MGDDGADHVPVPERKRRGRVLKEIGLRNNAEFRQRMVGQTLSAVALDDRTRAVTSNYLNVELKSAREPRRMCDVQIGAVTAHGLAEWSPLTVLT